MTAHAYALLSTERKGVNTVTADACPLSVDLYDDLEAAAPVWCAFEQHAIASPYQQFDYIAAWQKTEGAARQITPLIAVVRIGGRPAMVLPIGIDARGFLNRCVFLGGKNVNYAMALYDPRRCSDWTRSDIERILREIVRQRPDLDLFDLGNQPLTWMGCENPLTKLAHTPAASHSFKTALFAPFDEFALTRRSAKRLKDLRKKAQKAERELGPINVAYPVDPAGIEAALQTMLNQRAKRFSALSIADPYQQPEGKSFLLKLVKPGLDGAPPVLRLGVWSAGDKPLATIGYLRRDEHISCLLNSMVEGPNAIYSPGKQLQMDLMRRVIGTGATSIDFGIGEAAYKSEWCDVDPLVDSLFPVSPKGRVMARAIAARTAAKRAIKQNERVFSFYRKLRARLKGKAG